MTDQNGEKIGGDLLLEVMHIEIQLDSSTMNPVGSERLSPLTEESAKQIALEEQALLEALSFNEVFNDGDLLVQFMQFMSATHPTASSLLKFYMNTETYKNFAEDSSATPDVMRQDAYSHYELFFGPKAPYSLREFVNDADMEATLLKRIEREINAQIFDPWRDQVFIVMENRFWSNFKSSKYFCEWWDTKKIGLVRSLHRLSLPDKDIGEESEVLDDSSHIEDKTLNPVVSKRPKMIDEWKHIDIRSPETVQTIYGAGFKALDDTVTLIPFPEYRAEHLSRTYMSRHRRHLSDTFVVLPALRALCKSAAKAHGSINFKIELEMLKLRKGQDKITADLENAASAEGGTYFLNAALSTLREQVSVIEDVVVKASRRSSSHAASSHDVDIQKLKETKKGLQEQVKQLEKMVREMAQEEQGVDLHSVQIEILEGGVEETADALGIGMFSKKEAVYLVQVTSLTSGKGWMKQKTYTRFQELHESLKLQFPKVSKIPFPGLKSSAIPLIGATYGKGHQADLKRYLSMVVSDMVLAETKDLKEFLKPESVAFQEKESSEIGKVLKGIFKTTTGMLKKITMDSSILDIGSRRNSPLPSPNISVLNLPSAYTTTSDLHGLKSTVNSNFKLPGSLQNDSLVSLDEIKRDETESNDGTAAPERNDSILAPDRASSAQRKVGANVLESVDYELGLKSERPVSTTPVEQPEVVPVPITPPRSSSVPRKNPVIDSIDTDILLECVFTLLEETFHLTDETQWLRAKGLQVLKSLIRKTHGQAMHKSLEAALTSYTTDPSICTLLDSITSKLWPGGVLFTPLKAREGSLQEESKVHAKMLFTQSDKILKSDVAQKIIGRYNSAVGLTRLFNMLQTRDLNRGLVVGVLESLVWSLCEAEV